jgi:hypothetical protein
VGDGLDELAQLLGRELSVFGADLEFEAGAEVDVAAHLHSADGPHPRRHRRLTTVQDLPHTVQRHARLCERDDAHQLVHVRLCVVSPALLTHGLVEQADLDVVTHGAQGQSRERAELV